MAAAMSPARTSLISLRELECICTIRPTRSRLPFTGFSTWSPEDSTPEYTRKKVRVPTKGSVAILKARAENGWSSSETRVSTVSPSSSTPSMARTSVGAGRYSTTASSMACTPLFLNAEPHSAGTISLARVRMRSPCLISSSVSSPPSRYLSMSSSLASAAASIICSR